MRVITGFRLAVLAAVVAAAAPACVGPLGPDDRRTTEELHRDGDSPPRIGGYITRPEIAQRRTAADARAVGDAPAVVDSFGGNP